LVVAPPAGSAATSLRPQLRLVDSAPLTLTGLHFRSREFVRVTVTDGRRTLVRQARASTTGAFTVAFAGVRYDPCGTPPEITARGMRSGRVTGIGPVRDCAMP
jgi:hypothetical protein